MQNEIDEGKSEDEIANNSEITKNYDDLNYSWGFINFRKNKTNNLPKFDSLKIKIPIK